MILFVCIITCLKLNHIPFCFLRQLFGDITTHKHGLEVDPQVLHLQPVLDDLRGARQFVHPFLDLGLEWRVVPVRCLDLKNILIFWLNQNCFFFNYFFLTFAYFMIFQEKNLLIYLQPIHQFHVLP